MFLWGCILILERRELLVTILSHEGFFFLKKPSDARLSWMARVKPQQLCVALRVDSGWWRSLFVPIQSPKKEVMALILFTLPSSPLR